MFNSLKLEPEMYKYSLYLFSKTLTPGEEIKVWVNLTLMYGLVSAAYQCTHALRQIAEVKRDKYPLAYDVVMNTTYMDDSSGGSNEKEEFNKLVARLKRFSEIKAQLTKLKKTIRTYNIVDASLSSTKMLSYLKIGYTLITNSKWQPSNKGIFNKELFERVSNNPTTY